MRQINNRTKLEKVIPLDTPYVINVDPSSKCNLRCSFCFQSCKDKPEYNIMDFELYKKIIKDIKQFNSPLKTLRLYCLGEPLLNKNFENMVIHAKENNIAQSIDTTTNGTLLTKNRINSIIDSGINRINLSIYGVSSEQYKKFTGVKISFNRLIEKIKYLYDNKNQCYIFAKINGDYMTEEDKDIFINTFKDITDSCAIEHTMKCWNNIDIKANDKVGLYGQPIQNIEVCPYIFYSFTIHSDGQASSCFLDWNKKMIVGDASKECVKAIWRGDALKKHQILMLTKNRFSHPVCGNCGQLSHGNCDNIDSNATGLLRRFIGD